MDLDREALTFSMILPSWDLGVSAYVSVHVSRIDDALLFLSG